MDEPATLDLLDERVRATVRTIPFAEWIKLALGRPSHVATRVFRLALAVSDQLDRGAVTRWDEVAMARRHPLARWVVRRRVAEDDPSRTASMSMEFLLAPIRASMETVPSYALAQKQLQILAARYETHFLAADADWTRALSTDFSLLHDLVHEDPTQLAAQITDRDIKSHQAPSDEDVDREDSDGWKRVCARGEALRTDARARVTADPRLGPVLVEVTRASRPQTWTGVPADEAQRLLAMRNYNSWMAVLSGLRDAGFNHRNLRSSWTLSDPDDNHRRYRVKAEEEPGIPWYPAHVEEMERRADRPPPNACRFMMYEYAEWRRRWNREPSYPQGLTEWGEFWWWSFGRAIAKHACV